MKQVLSLCLSIVLFFTSFVVATYHSSVLQLQAYPLAEMPHEIPEGVYYEQKEFGIHQLVLDGDPFWRGILSGLATEKLLLLQEQELVRQLNRIIPNDFVQSLLFLFLMRWFQGIQDYIEVDWLHEMYGVSFSATNTMNHFADPFTRQLGYHALHEVGQMAIDSGFEGPGCTQLSLPNGNSVVIGRNFDFEAGRVFDQEKIMKWVFPVEGGTPYLSVIFAGMVGAVTGVNAHGVYVALNAAGSEDFVRLGTPSTLMITKALQYSKTPEEAVEILKNTPALITDIFWVAGTGADVYQVEKTPKRVQVIKLNGPVALTNHLTHKNFQEDTVNRHRMDNNTTLIRYERAVQLVSEISQSKVQDQNLARSMVMALRDRQGPQGQDFSGGDRRAIDAEIATHSVVYDGKNGRIYVSEGPQLKGQFLAFDLKKSFALKRPVALPELNIESDRK